ncbi:MULTISPECIES: phage holin family protein [Bacillaceae]|uniref:Phage holin family protein n=1 Tax=Evansella alkalicola TaxID=745819 RepID=A0ABS6K070_9BACI|nr:MULTISPECIES: phage holin family protein [Bacillaceae]MBU9724113.1 phage holin family protein [Bacillus alkalicola]
MELLDYIVQELLYLIPALMVLGKIIKNGEYINDKHIPVILLFVSVLFSNLILGFSPDSFIQGILIAGASVFGHQLIKQSKE